MKERPILFSTPMVQAILAGNKTQTRRIIKSPAKNMQESGQEVIKRNPDNDPWYKDRIWSMRTQQGLWGDYTNKQFLEFCPYGQIGDQLWVRETWQPWKRTNIEYDEWEPLPVSRFEEADSIEYRASSDSLGPWKPSIHMPRSESRIQLEITNIRVERLQDISEADAKAEGINHCPKRIVKPHSNPVEYIEVSAKDYFQDLWESINGPESWTANPWVWVIEFKRLDSQP